MCTQSVIVLLPLFYFFFFVREKKYLYHATPCESGITCGCASDVVFMPVGVEDILNRAVPVLLVKVMFLLSWHKGLLCH